MRNSEMERTSFRARDENKDVGGEQQEIWEDTKEHTSGQMKVKLWNCG